MEASRSVPFPGRIGRYELLLPIGAGGMATVYLARILVVESIHRPVAVKILHPELRVQARAAQDLIEEAKLVGSIRHPNVAKVIDGGDSSGHVYLVFDYIEGDTLAGILAALRKQSRAMPLSIAGKIGCDVLSGLQAAHQLTDAAGNRLELIHRDVSPQNVLVGVDGLSRLTDFGIAKALGRLSVTATGMVKGKTGYMSPEQARGNTIDQRTDVWASGVLLWELLCGRRLFREKNDVATLAKIVSPEPAPSLRRFRPDVPPGVDAVIARALAKDVSDRYASAVELRKAFVGAWTASNPIAEADEVGAFVAELCEPMLAERRDKAAQVIELHEKMDALALSVPPEPSTGSSERELTRTLDMPKSEAGRKRVFAAAAIAAIVLPLGAWAWTAWASHVNESLMRLSIPAVARTEPAVSASAVASASTIDPPADPPVDPPSMAAPRARGRVPARTTRSTGKRAVETVSGAQDIKLEPPPYVR